MIEQLRQNLSQQLAPILGLNSNVIKSSLESPKQAGHGQLAFPVFSFAKELRKAPPLIAKEFKEKIDQVGLSDIKSVDAISGFVNFTFEPSYIQRLVFS